ncbi:class I SAM-dependent methyltransferase [Streptomyces sp. NPDC018031]|uniref:class I SAM-dependent methyltransferase n=1 Tax=Streptomyces sp. NPDC018031 TaxID=3365033 RepID=UPI0037A00E01
MTGRTSSTPKDLITEQADGGVARYVVLGAGLDSFAVRDAGTGPPGRLPGVRHVSGGSLAERYVAGRADGLRPSRGEDLPATT